MSDCPAKRRSPFRGRKIRYQKGVFDGGGQPGCVLLKGGRFLFAALRPNRASFRGPGNLFVVTRNQTAGRHRDRYWSPVHTHPNTPICRAVNVNNRHQFLRFIMKTYNLFISHSWNYSDQYDRLMNLLRQRGYFAFRNYSVPPDDPIHGAGTAAQLREAIRNQMSPCHAVLILAGVYATYSKWINEEIKLAQKGFRNPKRIIAIRPRGSERISSVVQQAADEVVGWNTESVVRAIRKPA